MPPTSTHTRYTLAEAAPGLAIAIATGFPHRHGYGAVRTGEASAVPPATLGGCAQNTAVIGGADTATEIVITEEIVEEVIKETAETTPVIVVLDWSPHTNYFAFSDIEPAFEYYTVVKNVALPLIIAGEKPKVAVEQADKEFAFFGLEGCENQYPSQLSGGMRQRAALLRIYMQTQNVVLLDEPFGALDAITRKKMQKWYTELSQKLGLSTIIVTHDTDEALLLADKILVMNGTPATITGTLELVKPKNGAPFELTPEFLGYKRQLLALLS